VRSDTFTGEFLSSDFAVRLEVFSDKFSPRLHLEIFTSKFPPTGLTMRLDIFTGVFASSKLTRDWRKIYFFENSVPGWMTLGNDRI
jgi:hypothetical protein